MKRLCPSLCINISFENERIAALFLIMRKSEDILNCQIL